MLKLVNGRIVGWHPTEKKTRQETLVKYFGKEGYGNALISSKNS